MKRLLSVLFCIFATTAIAQAQNIVYFPQVADGTQSDGSRWGTIIVVTNPAPLGAGNSAGTLNFIKDDGTPLIIKWQNYGGRGSDLTNSPSPSIHFELAAGQTTVFISAGELGQSTTSLQTGFATLDSITPFSATVIFSEFGPGGGRIAQAGVLAATPSTKQEIIAIAPSPSGPSNIYPPNTATSAVALANPGTSTANITFQLLDSSSFQVGSLVTRTLAANNHTAFFVNQLFPNTAIGGQLRITSDVPIVGTALLFQNNGQFATFPVFPLP